ncbi:MAG: RecX family transcriptional regulator [Phycisphaerales bacterium]
MPTPSAPRGGSHCASSAPARARGRRSSGVCARRARRRRRGRCRQSPGRARLVDDATFAEQAAQSVLSRRPAGARFVEAKLRERGLDPTLARDAAREAMADRDPRADAIALAERAIRTMPAGLAPEVIRRRVMGRLARRGFDPDDAAAAIDRVLRRP